MGLKIITDDKNVKVVRQDKVSSAGNAYTKYSLMFAQKSKDGNWQNQFIEAQFKKGVSVNNKAVIKITNAFPVYDEYNRKKTLKIFVMDFEVVDGGEKPVEPPKDSDFMNVDLGSMQDLPFD